MIAFMASNRVFDQEIGAWDVSNVLDFHGAFIGTFAFNADISSWKVGKATRMSQMFDYATNFNQDLSSWDVSSSTTFYRTFYRARNFNGDISGWNVSSATNMNLMFGQAHAFDQDLGVWNVAKVDNFQSMFHSANKFNSDISAWDVGRATTLEGMLVNADAFDQDLCPWTTLVAQSFLATVGFDIGQCSEDGFGTFEATTPCETSSQCAEGLYCSFVDENTCQPKASVGQACVGSW